MDSHRQVFSLIVLYEGIIFFIDDKKTDQTHKKYKGVDIFV